MTVIALFAAVILSSCAFTSGSSTAVNASPGALTSPANPSADPAHHVTLSWNASMSSGVLGYNVYRGTESGGPYIKLNPSIVVSTNYRDNNVQSGQTYYYVVKATDSSNVESLRADEVAARVP